jgi:hypothetical protein
MYTHIINVHTLHIYTHFTHTNTSWRREKSREREGARARVFRGPGRPGQGGSAGSCAGLGGVGGEGGEGGAVAQGLRSSIVVLDATNFMSVYTMALPNRNLNLHYLT